MRASWRMDLDQAEHDQKEAERVRAAFEAESLRTRSATSGISPESIDLMDRLVERLRAQQPDEPGNTEPESRYEFRQPLSAEDWHRFERLITDAKVAGHGAASIVSGSKVVVIICRNSPNEPKAS